MTVGGTAATFTAFVVAAIVIALLMFGLAAVIATAQTHLVNELKMRVVEVKRWSGWLLVLVGVWLIVLAIWVGYVCTNISGLTVFHALRDGFARSPSRDDTTLTCLLISASVTVISSFEPAKQRPSRQSVTL